MSDLRVDVDTSQLTRGTKQLEAGIKRNNERVAMEAARTVANELRAIVPVLTGALLGTVQEERITDGAQVHYGGDLPYAGVIDRRDSLVSTATSGAEDLYRRLATDMAQEEVRRV